MKRLFVLGLLTVLAAPAYGADEGSGRYSFVPVEGGVLRLDAETGEVAFCKVAAETPTCTPANADVAATPGISTDDASRIAALERRIDVLEAQRNPEIVTDDEAIDRVTRLTERMMRSFFDLVREMKRDTEANEL